MNILELIQSIKRYTIKKKRKALRRLWWNWGISIPTLKHIREFEQLTMGCDVMSDAEVINHYGKRNQYKYPRKIGEDRGTQLYPCKVYDKNMKLIRIISVDEVQASVDASFGKTTWQQKAIEYKNRHGNAGNREEKQ
jgi:hypothetical protein